METSQADREARLTRLWVEHHDAVAAFARRRVDASAADDVVSEVFMTAWRRLDEVPREARAWLLGVARNVVMTQWRGSQRSADLARHLAAQPQAQLASNDSAESERIDLARAWMRLTESERELLSLVAWDGLSPAQAASVLGIGRTACAMRILRARRRFATLAGDPPSTGHVSADDDGPGTSEESPPLASIPQIEGL